MSSHRQCHERIPYKLRLFQNMCKLNIFQSFKETYGMRYSNRRKTNIKHLIVFPVNITNMSKLELCI